MSSDSHDETGRRHHPEEEHENHERWLVSYADFITLLFAFFVVMYATSTNNQEKQKSFEKSVRTNLKLSGVAGDGGAGTGSENASDNIIQIEGFPPRSGPGEAQDYINRNLEKNLDAAEKEKIQELRHDAIGVRISLASSQFFLPGGVKLRRESLSTLNKIAAILKETDRKVVIEGHTDNTPVAESALYRSNWELASLRATSIVHYLIDHHQIESRRLSATSYGDTRPIKNNMFEEGRALNRRIEIYLILDEKMQD